MKSGRTFSLIYKAIVAVMIVIVFTVMARYDFSPRVVLRNAEIAARSLYHQLRFYRDFYTADEKYRKYHFLWYPAVHDKVGVVRNDRERSYQGLTFFTSQEPRALLMDNEGNILHEWYMPFSKLWPKPKHARTFEPDKLVYWHKARLFPNGDVIAIYEGAYQVPYGVGIVKLNKDSEVIWKSEVNAHHDMDIDGEGNIYFLTHDYVLNEQTKAPFISDSITELSPDGKTLRKVDLYAILMQSGLRDLIDLRYDDPMHTNNLEFLRPDMAGRFPMFNAGDILISPRNLNAIVVLDGRTFEPKWDMRGVFFQQHDPDFTDNGTIRVFDNQGNRGKPGGMSRVVEIDPATKEIVWQYAGTGQEPLETESRGGHQQLPNGNILITESDNGRLIEITPGGEIVWEYINPSYDGTSIGILDRAERYSREDLPFLNASTNAGHY